MSNIIEVSNFSKSYGKVQAVKKINFYVEEGKLFSFLGPNGAGKSTTIDTLCTLLELDEGEIIVNEYDLQKKAHLIRKDIGVVFQDSVLDVLLTVRENLFVRAGLYMKGRKKIKKVVNEVIDLISLGDFANRPYGKLSGGQRRRADIGAALLHQPKILFLDEPTTGLDPQTRLMIWETIKELKTKSGMTIFLTTHYMEEAADSDYIIIIDHGEIVATGTPSQLKEEYTANTLHILPTNGEKLLSQLIFMNIETTIKNITFAGDEVVIKLANEKDALEILCHCKQYIESFKLLQGSMDDVFINITGKEIRQ